MTQWLGCNGPYKTLRKTHVLLCYGVSSSHVPYPVQCGEGWRKFCPANLHHGPRAGTPRAWDANGMLQPLELCAKFPPALHPGWCTDV